jgi:hypothetical protein
MLNNTLTIQIKLLLAILLGTAVASGAATYVVVRLSSAPHTTTVCPSPHHPALTPPPSQVPRERYFKVYKAKMNGERF